MSALGGRQVAAVETLHPLMVRPCKRLPTATTMSSLQAMAFRAAPLLKFTHSTRQRPLQRLLTRPASTRAPETDKSRILEKPAKFNPPSHGSRRVRPRAYPGPRITEAEREAMKTKRYPNMMPPEGSFLWRFLTDRRLHMWITLVSGQCICTREQTGIVY